jgi:EmrB/QacA subfamily drug resistance transporter
MTTTTRASGAPASLLGRRQLALVFGGLMLGVLLAALDQTIVATALPTIVGELGGLQHLSWVITAYLLTSTASTPLYGKISDLYGRKRVFQAAIVIFMVGSALAGLAQDMNQLIAFRAIQGLGAGGLIALAMAIIGEVVAPRERGRYQGYLGAVFGLASVAGPLAGGLFTDHLTWRWVFYVNLPLGLLALGVTAIGLNLPFHRVDRAIDYTGAALLVGGVTCALLVTVWGGNEYAWGSAVILGLGAAAALLLAAFVLWERRVAEPILPLRLFRNRAVLVAVSLMFLVGLALFGAVVFLPLFLQVVSGVSATDSGLLLIPLMIGIVVSSVIVGRLITRTGRYRRFPIMGGFVLLVGFALLTRLGVDSSRAEVSAYMVVVGTGLGMFMQVLVLAAQNAVELRDLGTTTSMASFARSLGGSFGTALFGAVLSARLSSELTSRLPAGRLPAGLDPGALRGSPATLLALPPAIRQPLVESFASAIHTVFLAAVPAVLAICVVVWFLPELPLRRSAYIDGAADGRGGDLPAGGPPRAGSRAEAPGSGRPPGYPSTTSTSPRIP